MARNINLNSSDWCDIIFEGKNKAYGAYAMRQSSSRRHLIAFSSVVVLVALVASIPKIMDAVAPVFNEHLKYDDTVVISDITIIEPLEEEIIEPSRLAPPPPPTVASIIFTPPIITPDSEVTPENEMNSQEALREFDGIISTVTNITDNHEGIDPRDLREEDRNITGEGDGGGGVREFVEQMPQPVGGTSELMDYLRKNLKYPVPSIEAGVEGRVFIKFVVGKDGSISGVHVLKGLDPLCDKEAIRVVEKMPKWIPGMQNGNKVAVYYTLPIIFKLMK
ncbi:energy transducer TonB [Viscerimonas tarda]